MDLGQIDIPDIIRTIIVADLTPSPVNAFNLYSLAVLNGTVEWDWTRLNAYN